MNRAVGSGTFEVKLTPAPDDLPADTQLGRLLIAKQFHGDLEGTSQGQMLTAGTKFLTLRDMSPLSASVARCMGTMGVLFCSIPEQ